MVSPASWGKRLHFAEPWKNMGEIVVYCDEASDELAAQMFLVDGPLPAAAVRRLPALSVAPPNLRALLSWERLDWVVTVDEEVRCTVELSRHGYTGDNGFQRFARLFRSASLGIPTIYFTPFSRTRLNELDLGQSNNARNVAPELFKTLADLEREFGVACMAVSWPVNSSNGQPAPLQSPIAVPAVKRMADLVARIISVPAPDTPRLVRSEFRDLSTAMEAHAEIAFRGTDTRGQLALPVELGRPDWVYDFLPESYFRQGKAEKALASLALDSTAQRPFVGPGDLARWRSEGQAWVLYLGYQWRPDPSCGLIALCATQAKARGLPLVVAWPRIFSAATGTREELLGVLRRFKATNDGPLADEMIRHGRAAQIADFARRVSASPGQFGLYTPLSKIGRVLADTAAAVVLGDVVLTFDNE
jgi:hypothetical protein